MQPQISFLSLDEQELIHQKALWLLSNVGFQMPAREAVDIMHRAGAKIEKENIVKIPAELVAYAVEKSPKRDDLVIYGREAKFDIHFGKDTPVLGSHRNATHVIDIETKERRLSTNSDVANIVRLIDSQENISLNAPTVIPQDVPQGTAEWYALATTLKNTSKPVCGPTAGARCVRDAVRMASLAAGGEEKFRQRPFLYFSFVTRPPLQVAQLPLEAFVELSRQGLPIKVSSGPILGMTSPITLAGTLAQVHAEVLSCVVLAQLIRPGTPIIYGSNARSMDMKTGNVSLASPEYAILKGAAGQMGRYLGLPVYLPAFLRDAKLLDAQAGFETALVGLVSCLGGDLLRGLEYDMDMLVDFADIVFSNEAMGALKRIVKGFSIDENTLALDIIKETGHGGSFLSNKHTLHNFRKEQWLPHLFERRAWSAWEKDGKKDIEQRAREKAREILASHQPQRLDPEVEAEIDRIAREARLD